MARISRSQKPAKHSDMADGTKNRSAKASPARDWLPLVREKPSLEKPFNINYVKANKERDWFLTLSWAMTEEKHTFQAKMMAKLYLFLRDYIPQGLTGPLGHIRGKDVMEHLLCYTGDQAMSRHRISRDADIAFTSLEKWMRAGSDWKEALDAHVQSRADPGEPAHRRKVPWRAPGLLSPAGMLALLVLAYPDMKFKARIGQLQIDWMLFKARATLDVREGYWKGINQDNIQEAFRTEEPRAAEERLLLDYTRLFGGSFPRWRRDLRPFLSGVSWAKHIRLEHPLSDSDSAADDPGMCDEVDSGVDSRHPTAPADMSAILSTRSHLFPGSAKTLGELEDWLTSRLSGDELTYGGELYRVWCGHWADKMNKAESFHCHAMLRSLFVQSLRRLESLSADDREAMVPAYMLLDMEDGEWEPRALSAEVELALRQIKKSPSYAACAGANTPLWQLVEDSGEGVRDLMHKASARLDGFLYEVFTHPSRNKYVHDVMAFESLRTRAIAQLPHEDRSEAEQWRRAPDGKLVAALKLTTWQLRASLVAKLQDVLTECQYRSYQQGRADPHELWRLIPQCETPGRAQNEHHKLLQVLFSNITQPQGTNTMPSPSWSVLTSPPSRRSTPTMGIAATSQASAAGEGSADISSQAVSRAASVQAIGSERGTPVPATAMSQEALPHSAERAASTPAESPSASTPPDMLPTPQTRAHDRLSQERRSLGPGMDNDEDQTHPTAPSLKRKLHEMDSTSGCLQETNSALARHQARLAAHAMVQDIESQLSTWVDEQTSQHREAFTKLAQQVQGTATKPDDGTAGAKRQLDLAEEVVTRTDGIRQVYMARDGACGDAFDKFRQVVLHDRDEAAVRYMALASEGKLRQEFMGWLQQKLEGWQEVSLRHIETVKVGIMQDMSKWEEKNLPTVEDM